jgi:hypothetical protein
MDPKEEAREKLLLAIVHVGNACVELSDVKHPDDGADPWTVVDVARQYLQNLVKEFS